MLHSALCIHALLATACNALGLQRYSPFVTESVVNISVCVPAIPNNVKAGQIFAALSSIEAQTARPREVIISLSKAGRESQYCAELTKRANMSRLSVRVFCSEQLMNAAASRNLAARAATSKYLGFFDADDVMHPQRIEVMDLAAKQTGARLIAHTWASHKIDKDMVREFYLRSAQHLDGVRLFDAASESPREQLWILAPMHHAHITVLSAVFDQVQFNTSTEYEAKEDSRFCRDVISTYGRHADTALYLDVPLSGYVPRESQESPYGRQPAPRF